VLLTGQDFLLSNNLINDFISLPLDLENEEVIAYFVSFLKTLSLNLNTNTVHFFFDEESQSFPLYTCAVKLFNHPENMVRIAVRTLTLNVFKGERCSPLRSHDSQLNTNQCEAICSATHRHLTCMSLWNSL
jgi:protein CLEC16A